MKISTNWIKDYVEINEDLKLLADKITSSGVNVESITSNKIPKLVIGRVISCVDHPDSDHLHVCKVDVGTEILKIICGADNVRKNINVIVSLAGCVLPGGEIKKGMIRGVESNGMICAMYELDLANKEETEHEGIKEIPLDVPLGMDAMEYLGLDDTVYTLDLNPNRNDCLSHLGFAYEVAAVLGEKITMPDITINPINEDVNDYLSVELDTNNCYIYQAKMVKDVVIKESPEFIKNRLISAGMRPINNVVDISNYIMLEYGQPLHFFDQKKLGNKIVVRMAKENEKVITLDEKERTLNNKDIVITDDNKIVCIAGVMGAMNTIVDSNTKNIIIESAIFNPINVRYTSIDLDLRSEASLRYEKKMNPEYAALAIQRACHLLEKYASGKVVNNTIIKGNVDIKEKQAVVNLDNINKLLGMKLTIEDAKKSLENLNFKYELEDETFTVTIPNRRMDVENNAADLIEEIGRLYGYDKIESTLPLGPTKPGNYIGNVKVRKMISNRLRSLGLNETRTYTLISEEEDKLFSYDKKESIKLLKPLSNDKVIIRQSILPSLLKVVDYNKSRSVKDICVYEIGNTYGGENIETTKISILMKGNYLINNWNHINIKVDFYTIKGVIENLFNYLGLKNRYSFEVGEIDSMHPGMSARILLDRKPIGFIGRVHPNISKEDIYVAEVNMNELADKQIKPIKHKEISKYPTISKDLAFVMNKNIESSVISESIKKTGGKIVTEVNVFDVYEGDKVGENEKSIAYNITFSDPNKTLTDEEVNIVFEKIIREVEIKNSVKLRSL